MKIQVVSSTVATATVALTTLSLSKPSSGFPQYATKIPNGHNVPNPGPQGGVWAGVGHLASGGGGDRNPFGLDFAAQGHEWTPGLCETDSDGDGRSNGVELGDPNCTWVEGETPEGPALSHPGIVDEPQGPAMSNCDRHVTPEDEITMDIGFTVPTQIDETQTHYICEQKLMDVPAETLLHKVKTTVMVDNTNILHHMFVFICLPESPSTDGDRVGQGFYPCSGNESGCRRVGGWALGPSEKCEPPNVGEELDFANTLGGQVIVKVEAHYDNTSGQSQQDQSGMRLHLTPTLRPLSGTSLIAGMAVRDNNFLIPKGQVSATLSSICPTAITEFLQRPVFAYAFAPHMHKYGRSTVTEHYRCGEKIGEIGRIDAYEFDNQQTYTLNPPVKVLPGDSFVTTCGYDTSASDMDILGGEETKDEMCLNFISVYPHPGGKEQPGLLATCMSFENGLIQKDDTVSTQRFSIGGMDRAYISVDFESDPTANIGSCCAANNCQDLYRAVEGEACGVSDDCLDDLVCDGGMCQCMGDGCQGDTNAPGTPEEAAISSAVRVSGSVGAILILAISFLVSKLN